MRIFTSPLRYVKKMRARRRQVRTVLHMLSASGVIRLGHIEPRYFEPSSHVDALYRQGTKRVNIPSLPVTSVAHQSLRLRVDKASATHPHSQTIPASD